MRQNLAWALTGLIGGVLFLVFFGILVPENYVVSGGVATAGVLAGWLMFVRTARRTVSERGIDQAGRLKEAWANQRKLAEFARRSPNKPVRVKIEGIADVVERILKDLRQDPADFPKASQFLDYYLVSTVAVVGKYLDLLGRAANAEGMGALRSTEATLDTIKAAFEKLYQQLLENEVMDLDVELKVLNSTIAMEGLGDGLPPKSGGS